MNTIARLRDIAGAVDNPQRDLMISESVLALAGIFGRLDVIGSIVPEESDGTSSRIIRVLSCEIDRTRECIAVHLIFSREFMVRLELVIILEDQYWRSRIEACLPYRSSGCLRDTTRWRLDILHYVENFGDPPRSRPMDDTDFDTASTSGIELWRIAVIYACPIVYFTGIVPRVIGSGEDGLEGEIHATWARNTRKSISDIGRIGIVLEYRHNLRKCNTGCTRHARSTSTTSTLWWSRCGSCRCCAGRSRSVIYSPSDTAKLEWISAARYASTESSPSGEVDRIRIAARECATRSDDHTRIVPREIDSREDRLEGEIDTAGVATSTVEYASREYRIGRRLKGRDNLWKEDPSGSRSTTRLSGCSTSSSRNRCTGGGISRVTSRIGVAGSCSGMSISSMSIRRSSIGSTGRYDDDSRSGRSSIGISGPC